MNNTPPGERNVPPTFTVGRFCRRNATVIDPSARPGQNFAGNNMPAYLYHFSEDPTIEVFAPHVADTQQVEGEWVWAVDDYRAPTYWFPRQCPRGFLLDLYAE
jgi:hypothetical protein